MAYKYIKMITQTIQNALRELGIKKLIEIRDYIDMLIKYELKGRGIL